MEDITNYSSELKEEEKVNSSDNDNDKISSTADNGASNLKSIQNDILMIDSMDQISKICQTDAPEVVEIQIDTLEGINIAPEGLKFTNNQQNSMSNSGNFEIDISDEHEEKSVSQMEVEEGINFDSKVQEINIESSFADIEEILSPKRETSRSSTPVELLNEY
mmetsp:Transcript_15987/g.17754  ORF Transcript_15987/g.17754 Transcript_15987/m.17754 type:complete len:163 (+) Transcript_15987:294-782(+)|eukprot:CAMPEP_0205812862 /NCGR_PEP_ID=MMETSP0205-20121125/17483_1 /ASSEMBLY_ACC=CAM_ASM_000278 /TAXON_ID=36767 /ORGANISM="Euplotes focardii, Strain TN1" /LENGTH=162 /DNA_ID=CAMNT_0053094299 /DNA_START=1038 /DNA_END=1526 /DNA_ORIENTATION=-